MKLETIGKNLIYGFKSLFYKKDKSIVICDSWMGSKFADNPRFLFQYLSANKEKLGLTHVVWVTYSSTLCNELNEMGYEAYLMESEQSIYYHKHSKYQICNNFAYNSAPYKGELLDGYSYRSKRINLWHGTGAIKTFNMASNEYKAKVAKHPLLYKLKNFIYQNSKLFRNFSAGGGWLNCYFLTTSQTEFEKFKLCFPLPDDHFIISGYPRNSYDVEYIKYLKNEENVLNKLKNYNKVILYLPTFRSDSSFDMTNLSKSLNDVLSEHNLLFVQKAHSAYTGDSNFENYSNIINLDSDFDINVLTPYVDLVITDYSSILADAMYYNKPVVLYTPDFDEYVHGDRGLSNDAELILSSALRFDTIQDIKEFIRKNCDDFNVAKQANYVEIRNRIWGNENKSMEVIWNDILTQTK